MAELGTGSTYGSKFFGIYLIEKGEKEPVTAGTANAKVCSAQKSERPMFSRMRIHFAKRLIRQLIDQATKTIYSEQFDLEQLYLATEKIADGWHEA